MAVAYVTASQAGTAFSNDITFPIDCTGADFLTVAIGHNQTITTCSFSGSALTPVETGSNNQRLYTMIAPAQGTYNVKVTTAASECGNAIAVCYSGVDQTTPYDGLQFSATGNASASVAVTSSAGNLVVGMSAWTDNSGAPKSHTPGAGQTERGDSNVGDSQQTCCLSDEPGAASVTHSYTRVGGGAYYGQRIIAINVRAAPSRRVIATLTDNTDGTTYTVPSWTRTNGKLYELWVVCSRNGGSFTISSVVDNGGLTWVEEKTTTITDGSTTTGRFSVYRALVASGAGSGTTVITTGTSVLGCVVTIVETDNPITTGTNGSGAIIQSPSPTTGNDTSVEGPTLSAFASSNNYAVLGVAHAVTNSTIDIETGYTESTKQSTDGGTGLMVGWQVGQDTAPTATLGTTTYWGAISLEIGVASAPEAPAVTYYFSECNFVDFL